MLYIYWFESNLYRLQFRQGVGKTYLHHHDVPASTILHSRAPLCPHRRQSAMRPDWRLCNAAGLAVEFSVVSAFST
jgi:hypothetical protein